MTYIFSDKNWLPNIKLSTKRDCYDRVPAPKLLYQADPEEAGLNKVGNPFFSRKFLRGKILFVFFSS